MLTYVHNIKNSIYKINKLYIQTLNDIRISISDIILIIRKKMFFL